jgi:HPt (histidine-containing phosphotransfer) domain-containing protein
MPAPTDAIDSAVYAELQDTAGAEFAAELVGTFFEEAPLMLADLRSALAERNRDRFRRAAHSLKSNSHTFGATKLAELARELELGGLAVDGTPLDALDAEYARAAAALQALADG